MSTNPSPLAARVGAMTSLWFNNACYLLVGMDDAHYYSRKALALSTLNDYPSAIKCLEKALDGGESSYCRGQLAWCYYKLDDFERALENYRISYQRRKTGRVAIGLICAALRSGQREEAGTVMVEVRSSYDALDPRDKAAFDSLAAQAAGEELTPNKVLWHVACPSCKKSPLTHDRWRCDCGNRWNTFSTQCRCPACNLQWHETKCPACHQLSPSAAWYGQH